MSDPHAGKREPTVSEVLIGIGKFLLIGVGIFVVPVLMLGPPALLWPESTLWVLSEESGWKAVAAAASSGICLILGAAAFVFKYIPLIGAALAFMARGAFMVFIALFFISALPGLLSMPTITGAGGAL